MDMIDIEQLVKDAVEVVHDHYHQTEDCCLNNPFIVKRIADTLLGFILHIQNET